MSYCINPKCQKRQNPDSLERCQACGSSLIINERYRLIRPLRELDKQHPTEIFEVDNWGTLKVLKVLTSNRHRLVKLFQREAEVLQRLNHVGTPKVDTYFVFSPSNGPRELHCLVMEKVEGQNLAQWLEENGPIPEALALNWLQQLVDSLNQVHRERLLHRDVKPSNIMRCPDGHLVLIDFGTVREITPTYIEKLEGYDVTRVYSPGYTAPEQRDGQAVVQSDFFSLGRTFVHLLTGTHPDDLSKLQTSRLIWRDNAPQTSAWLVDLIDELMAPLPQDRPGDSQVILDRLVEGSLSNRTGIVPRPAQKRYPRAAFAHQLLRSLRTVFLASVVTTSLVMGVRQLGMLQPLELEAFDQLLRLRPAEPPDPRLLVITVTEADIQAQTKQGPGSLSDPTLTQLLQKLEQYQPRAIGLDIYHAFPVGPDQAGLAARLQQNDRLVAICKVSTPEANDPGVPPPPEIPQERLGFSDIVVDDDNNTVRRQLLQLNPPPTSACFTEYALSLQLALHYLAMEGIQAQFTPEGNLQLGDVLLKRFAAHTGGYQKVDTAGYQVLLNYRPYRSLQDIATQVTLGDVLHDRLPADSVRALKDRVVLIGVTAPSYSDYWSTPYSADQPSSQKQIPGVLLQAQMVSHLLSAVLDQRPLLWVWSQWSEVLWIWGWSLVGGILAWRFRPLPHLGLASGMALGTLYGLCFSLLTQGGWVPLVPSALALVATGGSVVIYTRSTDNSSRYRDLEGFG